MKNNQQFVITGVALLFFILLNAFSFTAKRDFYQIKIYHLKDKTQENRLDQFLQNAYLPALHHVGISKVGVFKPIVETGAAEPGELLLYVFIPFKSEKDFFTLESKLLKDKIFSSAAIDYLDAAYNNPHYTR
ncbi:MAG: NIPSNAP family containing protein, partial [Saprospiraceae bacterium]